MKSAPPDDPLRLSEEGFARIARFITGHLGICMPESKLAMVESRLMRRVRTLGLASLDEYCQYAFDPAHAEQERLQIVNALTTNKTDFFREPDHFEFLLARLRETDASRFTVWSAGCASGEEAYTLAMLLSEHQQRRPGFSFEILATDVSTRALGRAREGIYSEAVVEVVPPELRRKYFRRGRGPSVGLVRVEPALRRKIAFHHLNFMDADYRVRDHFDAIFFRNVMIYFARTTQQDVVGKLCRNLVPGGYLFISHSESLTGLDVPVRVAGASVFRKPS